MMEKIPKLSVVGIAGPGDPLANPKETFSTLRLIGEKHPSLQLCLATNGLALMEHLEEIKKVGIGFVTVTVNAIHPEIGSRIYEWILMEGRKVTGKEASSLLWERQKEGISALVKEGVRVKINTVVCPGMNDAHIPDVSREVGALGANLQNIMPLLPVPGSLFENLDPPSAEEINKLRKICKEFIPQMGHCRQCRADAVGLLGADIDLTNSHVIGEGHASCIPL